MAQRMRGALGIGMTWAAGWAPVGAITGLVTGTLLGFPLGTLAIARSARGQALLEGVEDPAEMRLPGGNARKRLGDAE